MVSDFQVNLFSEIGELRDVIIHRPGPEVQNMTPENAERALYNDILNLSIIKEEYWQFENVLSKVANTYTVMALLEEVLSDACVKSSLIKNVCQNEKVYEIEDFLSRLSNGELARQLIEGVVLEKNNLTNFLSNERFILRPLHNFFFTRDASMAVRNNVLIGKMANHVREREALIMKEIFNAKTSSANQVIAPCETGPHSEYIMIEGGDFLVASETILLMGTGTRTTSQGIDFIIEVLKKNKIDKHIIVQELPHSPESFIHLDMVFTILDQDKCMIFEPLILKTNKYQTIHILIENGNVKFIREENNIPDSLKKLGMDLEPICCGGHKDLWVQEREQWHSGANFFALGPGKVIGYGRNVHTIEEMEHHGYEVIPAMDVIKDKVNLKDYSKYVITIEGSEMPRGGGGARCMTLPVNRKDVD